MSQEEINELACAVLDLDYGRLCEEGDEYEVIDEELNNKFDIGIERFVDIVKALLPFTPIVVSDLSGKKYHTFSVEKGSYGRMIVKQEVEEL